MADGASLGDNPNVGLIGAGNMATALARGLIQVGVPRKKKREDREKAFLIDY